MDSLKARCYTKAYYGDNTVFLAKGSLWSDMAPHMEAFRCVKPGLRDVERYMPFVTGLWEDLKQWLRAELQKEASGSTLEKIMFAHQFAKRATGALAVPDEFIPMLQFKFFAKRT